MAKDVYKDKKNAEMIRKLESLEVKDGKIILKVRAKGRIVSRYAAAKKEVPVEIVAPPKNGEPKSEPAKKSRGAKSRSAEPQPKS